MLLKQIHHFALVVVDLDASIEWYRSMLGFQLERRFSFPESGVQIAHLVTEAGIRAELIEQQGSTQSPDEGQGVFEALKTRGIKHVGFLVDDIEATARDLRARGVEIVTDITTVEPAGVKNFWIRDNSGNLFEINQWLE